MTAKPNSSHISNIEINSLNGRMLNLPAKNNKRNILFLYGHHASLERMFGIADNFNDFGSVTIPDLPGLGGMDSFYKIGMQPTIDNFADYLASFIKLRFKNKRFTLVSMSFSFLIVTKMLQKYPEIAKNVDILVSSVGFVHYEDFSLPKYHQLGIRIISSVLQLKPFAYTAKHTLFSEFAVKSFYKHVGVKHSKMQDAGRSEVRDKRIEAEVILWRINDVRTRMRTANDFFRVDLLDRKIDLPIYHVYIDDDRYFNNRIVEQHMRIIYKDFTGFKAEIVGHMPSIVATKKEADLFVPPGLKELLK